MLSPRIAARGRCVTDKSDSVRLSDEQRLDWLRLIRSVNVEPRTFRALINHYGGARAALSVLPDLARRGGAKGPARIPSREDAAREVKAAKALGATFVALGEPDYPPPSADDRRRPAASGRARTRRRTRSARARRRRRTQCVGCGRALRRAARARPPRGRPCR